MSHFVVTLAAARPASELKSRAEEEGAGVVSPARRGDLRGHSGFEALLDPAYVVLLAQPSWKIA